MVPSEAEIEARLAELRRRREALDREIADHLLYLELGRRLRGGAGPSAEPETGSAPESASRPGSGAAEAGPSGPAGGAPPGILTAPDLSPRPAPGSAPVPPAGPRPWAAPVSHPQAAPVRPVAEAAPAGIPAGIQTDAAEAGAPAGQSPGAWPGRAEAAGAVPPPAVPFEEDPAAARRYGRALVEAALAVLTAANRPMHAGEILEHLAARGFAVPGQDPVAALNTRLWKRSGPGGPLRRLGEAVYDRADGPGSAASFGLPDLS